MSMVLSHGTALEMYRSSLMPVAKWERVAFESLSVPTQSDVLWFRSLPIKTNHFPLHCVVPKASNRREIKDGRCHVLGCQMEAIRLRRSADGSSLCVVSPEVLFLQMAASLSAIELVRLGFELCGNYSLPMSQPNYAGTPRGFVAREALTSVMELSEFVASHDSSRSVKNARAALRYIADGSASPKQTELCMLMVLPRKMGGYGLAAPSCSCASGTPEDTAAYLSGKARSFGLCWPAAGIAIRYGTGGNGGAKRPGRDCRRCALPSYSDMKVLSVSNRDIRHSEKLDGIADAVARKHGRYLRRDLRYDFAARQATLREQVLSGN